ncbi:universal stress protein [Actinoplanes sp. NBRC 101535]|nr:universal stress protein [Actinoplanes sp. NBRC 101535]
MIGYDGSPGARAAFGWALDEAERAGAPAELVQADQWPLQAAGPSPMEHLSDDAVLTARRTHPGVPVTVTTVRAHPTTALIGVSGDAGLVVLGGRGHGAVAGLLGSVGSAVSASARCPVVAVRGDSARFAPVVAGIDGSRRSARVVRFAAAQAVAHGVPLRVLHVRPGAWEDTPLDHLVRSTHREFPELPIEAEIVDGDPAAALTAAGRSAQLLVVGGSRDARRGLLLDSVSQHLMRHATCTVAVVPLLQYGSPD